MRKKLTKANIEELAYKIDEYLNKELEDDAYCIYFNGKRINAYKNPRIVEENCNPLDYNKFFASYHILSITSEGMLHDWYDWKLEFPKKLENLFKRYGIYFECCDSCNWTACPLDGETEVEYTIYEREPEPINVRYANVYVPQTFIYLANLWDELTSRVPEEGSIVSGAGIKFTYGENEYFISSPICRQCSISWEKTKDPIIKALEDYGCKGVHYFDGWMN